ncbi:MAG: nitroreductase family protein [Oscillospiraceae bacterium]|nr:nitroreductase family protein [Oscillospiraceae bacterium]
MIQINNDACIGCGRCAYDCFPGAITVTEKAELSNPAACIGCGHCVAICPVAAVSYDGLPADDVMPSEKNVSPERMLGLMRSRRSCRHYKTLPLPDTVLNSLLQAARACPTARNLQATRFIAVRDKIPELLDLALDTLGRIGQTQRETAADPSEIRRAENFIRWQEQRRTDPNFDPLFFHAPQLLIFVSPKDAVFDAAAAAAYTELMAASLDLGCLYSGYFTACAAMSPEIRDLLGIGETEQLVRCLVLGYPDVAYPRTAPRNLPQVTYL